MRPEASSCGVLSVSGSRRIGDAQVVADALDGLRPGEIVTGGARGVDTLAAEWAQAHGVPVVVIRPDWRRYGRGAGLRRTEQMIDRADEVLAVWDGESAGTRHAIEYAREKGKPTHVVRAEATS